ncbi:hypothetical protein FisN_16Lh022 [Fistulifera solaris]|uniref:Uncharacterized protein n=1 Tax=Fistulifera solaris TaxID=1519565 RepID=A0A1Z5KIX4_FISSO|nr:hypothetical protein FisN_16Lh022 [Fistulifera solaris]|eukprot:GAX26206.1 hypothetical protein FisN_16Lh022 [Fistulifera solaris]
MAFRFLKINSSRQRRGALRALSYSANGPSATQTTWQRAAVRVKNTETEKNNSYLELIRDTHDPSLHLKTIEEELQGSIGKALGKQGQKILLYVQLMHQEYQRYETLLQQAVAGDDIQHIRNELSKAALAYNEHRKQAIQARWELMVHRQAAGFIVNNHQHVMEHYPIAEALPIDYDDKEKSPKSENTRKEKKIQQFGDQLDWWQRVGRWK